MRNRLQRSVLRPLAAFTTAGLLVCYSGSPAAAQLATIGDLLVADAGANAVFVVDVTTGQQSLLASGAPLSDPSGITVDPTTGLVYVTDRSGGPGGVGALLEIDPVNGAMTVVSSGNQLALPEDVIVSGSTGKISVIDGLSGIVVVEPTTGNQTLELSQTGSAITRLTLFGRQRAADVVVIDPGPLEVHRIISSNNTAVLVGQGGTLQLPTGITNRGPLFDFVMVADAGNLALGDGQVVEIRITNFSAMNPSANQRVVSSGMNLVDPLDIVSDVAGTFLYAVDPGAAAGAGAVVRVDVVTGDQLVLSSGGSFVNPVAIELFPQIASLQIRPDLYVADESTAEILRVGPVGGAQSVITTGALLVEPSHVLAVPGIDDLLVADRRLTGPGAVVRVDAATGGQTLVTEGGSLSEPQALIRLQGGDLLVADSFAPALVRVDPASGVQTDITAAPADLRALAQVGNGTVYGLRVLVAEVVAIDLGGGGTQTVGSGGDLGSAVDLVAETDGTLAVLTSTGKVVRLDPSTYDNGNPSSNQTLLSSAGELIAPTGIGVAPDNELYVVDPLAASGAGAVIRISAVSGSQTVISTGGGGIFVAPSAIGSGRPLPGPGDILVADPNKDLIVMIDPQSGDQSIVSRKGRLAFPDGIALDIDGSLLVAESQNNELLRIDLETGQQTIVAKGPDLPDPRAVTVGPGGEIYVGSRVAPFPIVEVARNGGGTTVIGINVPTVETRFSGLQKLAVDPASGDILLSTNVVGLNVSGDALRRLDPSALPLPTTPTDVIDGSPLVFANEMVVDPVSGDVFMANGDDILRIDLIQQTSAVVSEGGFFDRAQGLAMDAQGQLVTTTVFGDSIVRVDPMTGGQQVVSHANQLGQPQGIVVIPAPEPGAFAMGVAAIAVVSCTARTRRRRLAKRS